MSGWGSLEDPVRISEINFDARRESFQGVVLYGNAHKRGRIYGRAFADKIKRNVTRTKLDAGTRLPSL